MRARRPMLQLQIAPAPGRVVIFEFRPRDRGVARQLVKILGNERSGAAVNEAEPPEPVSERGSERSGAAGHTAGAQDPVSDRGGAAE